MNHDKKERKECVKAQSEIQSSQPSQEKPEDGLVSQEKITPLPSKLELGNYAEKFRRRLESQNAALLEKANAGDFRSICEILSRTPIKEKISESRKYHLDAACDIIFPEIRKIGFVAEKMKSPLCRYIANLVTQWNIDISNKHEILEHCFQFLLENHSEHESREILTAGFPSASLLEIEDWGWNLSKDRSTFRPYDRPYKNNKKLSVLCYEYAANQYIKFNDIDGVTVPTRRFGSSLGSSRSISFDDQPTNPLLALSAELYKLHSELFNSTKFNESEAGENHRERAIHWLKIASSFDDPGAFEELAEIYEEGKFLEKDRNKSKEYWEKYAFLCAHGSDVFRVAKKFAHKPRFESDTGFEPDYGLAMAMLRRPCAMESSSCQYLLGHLYEHGLGTSVDYPQAAHWYGLAVDSDEPDNEVTLAMVRLARLYELGLGVPKDDRRALDFYHEAADGEYDFMDDFYFRRENYEAKLTLAKRYAEGIGVTTDIARAERYLISFSNETSYLDNKFRHALIRLDCEPLRKHLEGLSLLVQAAQEGCLDAIDRLCECVKLNETDELKSFTTPCVKIGQFLNKADSCDQRESRSPEFWFAKGFELMSGQAAVELAAIKSRQGDHAGALQILEAGSKFEGSESKVAFAHHLLCKESSEEEYAEAVALLTECHFNDTADFLLGACYRQGIGVSVDLEKAFDLLINLTRSENSDPYPIFELANIYLNRNSSHYDRQLGIQCLERAAAKDSPPAKELLDSLLNQSP